MDRAIQGGVVVHKWPRRRIPPTESAAVAPDAGWLEVNCMEVFNNSMHSVELDVSWSPETGKMLVIVTEVR